MTTNFLVNVGDIVLENINIYEIQHITQLLDDTFKIKDLGKLKYFLGLDVAWNKFGIYIS